MSSLLCILLVSSAPYELAGGIGIVVQQAVTSLLENAASYLLTLQYTAMATDQLSFLRPLRRESINQEAARYQCFDALSQIRLYNPMKSHCDLRQWGQRSRITPCVSFAMRFSVEKASWLAGFSGVCGVGTYDVKLDSHRTIKSSHH